MEESLLNKSDAELVGLSLENKENYSGIIERYKNPLRRYIRRLTSFSDDYVDDILQDVFIRAYINLNDFDISLSFSSWIYRITHNETISSFRKNKKHIDSSNSMSDEDLAEFSSDFDIEKELYKKYFNKVLRDSINELPEKYRSVIILKFIEGKDYTEISDILKKPPGTIATWIKRAKVKLKEILNKKEIKEYE